MFRNIFEIYKQDMKKIATNWVAFIILSGLALLPSLYAWVNIGASWDPYSNTKGVKVGIVNEDKGSTFKGTNINIGEGVIESLKKNTKLGWVFFKSAEEGKTAVEKGQVYATIIIPDDFSHKLTTVLDTNPVKPKLEYYVNEKINAIAPKMTDSGATTIQKQISTSFVDTSIQKAFEIFNKVGIQLNDYYPQIEKYKTELFEIDEKFPELYKKMDSIIDTSKDGLVQLDGKNQDIKDVQKILETTTGFMDDISKNLVDSNQKITDNSAQLKENLALIQSLSSNVSKTTKELEDSVVLKKPEVINNLNNSINDIDDLNKNLEDLASKIEKSGIDASGELKKKQANISSDIKSVKDSLTKLKDNINSNKADVSTILKSLAKTSADLVNQIDDMIKMADNSFAAADSALKTSEKLCDDLDQIITKASSQNGTVRAEANKLIDQSKDKIKALNGNPIYANALPLKSIEESLNKLQSVLNDNSTAQQVQEMLQTLSSLNTETKRSIATVEKDLDKQHGSIDKNLEQMRDTAKAASRLCSNLQANFSSSTEEVISKINSTLTKLDEADAEIKKSTDKLATSIPEDAANVSGDIRKLSPMLKDIKQKLTDLREKIKNHDNVENLLHDVSTLTYNLDTLTQKILIGLNGNILPTIQSYLKNSSVFVLDIRDIITNSNKDLDVLKDFISKINNKGQMSVDELKDVKNRLPKMQKTLHTITTKIKEFEKTASLQDIIDLMKKDGNKEGNFISQPVDLNTHKLFAMGNYGAAMTPFYSTLSLWVGALLLTALLSTKAKNVDFKATPVEEFFGKYLLFGTYAMLQGFIVCLGNIVVLGIRPQEPVLLVCLGVFYSLVFTMIVYSLVSLFGNVGKAIGVVFMVVQLAGSGGTFPIEVTPKFFQVVYSMLPFTYAISGMREAIGGVVFTTLIKDISVLLTYFVGFMIIGLTLKRSVNKILNILNHKLGESGIVEH